MSEEWGQQSCHNSMDSDLYVCGQSLVMSEEPVLKDETTHCQWNITAIPYKYNYILFTCGRWARQKIPTRRKLDVKLNLTGRTIFYLIYSAQISHSSSQTDNCGMWPIFGSWRYGQMLHAGWLWGYILSLISVQRGTIFYFLGEEQKKPWENNEAAIRQNVHLALPNSSAKAFWESERLSWSPLIQAIIWTRFPNLQGRAVIAPPQGEIGG